MTKVVQMWQSEWGGKAFFAHGESNSRGVAILIGKRFVGTDLQAFPDEAGRFLHLTFDYEGE